MSPISAVSDPNHEAATESADETPISPVAAPEHLEAFTPANPSDFYSRCVFALSLILCIAALIGSGIAFAGFAENDQNATHLLSAFALCFGIGALLLGPMALIAFYAKHAIHQPLPRLRAFIVILLMLPWFGLGYYIYGIGDSWKVIALCGSLAALFIVIWALRYFKAR